MRQESAGLLLTMAGFVSLSLGDAVVKSMTGLWAPTAIATLRYVLAAMVLAGLVLRREGPHALLRPPRPGMQLLRGFSVAVGTICFFAAIFLMPLAEAVSITFTGPLLTAVLAALFLREPAGRVTWIAMLFAFCGVMIVLRPNLAELGLAALLPLLTAVGMSSLFVANRAVAGAASSLAMQAYVALAASPILIAATAAGHFSGLAALHLTWPEPSVAARCALVAVTATTGHWLIYLGAVRAGPARTAPMTYIQLLVAGLLGWLWFGDVPDITALLGAGIIVASGVWLWWSQRRQKA